MNRLRQPNFSPVEGGEIKPRFTADRFTNDASILNNRPHRLFNDLLLDLDQLDRMFDNARLWVAAMPLGS